MTKLYVRNGFFISAASVAEAHLACRRMAAEPHAVAGLMPGAGRITRAVVAPEQQMAALSADGYQPGCYVLTTDGVVHVIGPGDPMPVAKAREWAVVGMDGEVVGRYASKEAARRAADEEAHQYAASRPGGDRSYLPRSVAHLACGEPRRQGQFSTAWGVGCAHE